jgi:xylulokinase
MFLSPVFGKTLAGLTGALVELYNTDGSTGAALGAGLGCGYFASPAEAFTNLKKLETILPDKKKSEEYHKAYENWEQNLKLYNYGSINRE